MSTTAVRKIVQRAIEDEKYRQLLFTKPDEALEGYELTSDERKKLSSLNESNFDEFAGPLSGRTTKGAWRPGVG